MPDAVPLHPDFLRIPLAHRGLHDRSAERIENSRAACGAAIQAGYGIEIDIQRAACGTPMVFHDETLDRLTGVDGAVADLDAGALRTIQLTGGGEGIPTLAEILDLVAGQVPLLIEIKDQDGAGHLTADLARRVAEDLETYAGPVAVMSFNPHAIATLAEVAPRICRGLTTADFRDDSWARLSVEERQILATLSSVRPLGCSFISHDRRSLDHPPVTLLSAEGLPVLTWTIRSPEEERDARRIAANITFEGYRPAH